jgi:hypothetical protein
MNVVVELTNRGTVPATGIKIRDTYDDGLKHQSPSPLERIVDYLAPGQTASFGILFHVNRPGRLCQHVEATAADGAHVATDLCVNATAPAAGPATVVPAPGSTTITPPPAAPRTVTPLVIRVSGPAAAIVGKSVVFSADITNPGQQAVTNIVVSQQSDTALLVTQATMGAASRGNQWTWTIPSLPPGQSVRRQVECECKQSGNACCHFAVMADNSQPATGQTCVDIAAAPPPSPVAPPPLVPGKLSVTVDNRNLVTAGKDQKFSVQVTNQGDSAENDIVVTASIPPGATIANGTYGPNGIQYQIDQGLVRFGPFPELPSKAAVEYRIVVTTTQPGQITLQVGATSRRQTHATDSKTVSVLPSE